MLLTLHPQECTYVQVKLSNSHKTKEGLWKGFLKKLFFSCYKWSNMKLKPISERFHQAPGYDSFKEIRVLICSTFSFSFFFGLKEIMLVILTDLKPEKSTPIYHHWIVKAAGYLSLCVCNCGFLVPSDKRAQGVSSRPLNSNSFRDVSSS